ncbi:hypothetical protein CEXT_227501 [Caerostris extrusa]|uniref:Uncharacterized protein n=1 Tax=Caerostris extrusa TaxID=172846 RepID=A0AAV4WPA2_CAEEX|nr:hypothetical protein CEXT_227501 [Caerostris extrusa]
MTAEGEVFDVCLMDLGMVGSKPVHGNKRKTSPAINDSFSSEASPKNLPRISHCNITPLCPGSIPKINKHIHRMYYYFYCIFIHLWRRCILTLPFFEQGHTYPPFTPVCSGDLARFVHPAKLLTVSSSSNDRPGANIDHSGLKPPSKWGDGRTSPQDPTDCCKVNTQKILSHPPHHTHSFMVFE